MNCAKSKIWRVSFFSGILILFCFLNLAKGQNSVPSNQNSNSSNTNSSAAASPTPIPFSEITTQSENASATLQRIRADISADAISNLVERDLPALTDEINARLEETAQVLEGANSLDSLKTFESDWQTMTERLPRWNRDLTARARILEANFNQVNELGEQWQKTLEELRARETPPEILTNVESIIQTSADVRGEIESAQARIATLQSRTTEQQSRVNEALGSLRQTREALFGQLLVQDSAPIWSANAWRGENVFNEFRHSLSTQLTGLSAFILRNQNKIATHFAIFVLLVTLLVYFRKEVKRRVSVEPELKKSAIIFYFPLATALILAILFNTRIYPQSPRILGSIFGAISIIPAVIILRNLFERSLYPILYLLVALFFIDQIRVIADGTPSIVRPIFIFEMLGAFLAFLWFYRKNLSRVEEEETVRETTESERKRKKIFQVIRTATMVILPLFAFALFANIFGYVNLARLVGNAVLRSAYTALVIYALVRILDGLIVFALHFKPLNLLKMVENYAPTIQQKLKRYIRFAAVFLWLATTLEYFTLRETIVENLKEFLTAKLEIGSVAISLSDVILFFLVIWAAFLISRFIRFVLEEDIYPRLSLAHGIPYAISTILNYAILLVGFFLAVGVAGFDFTKFTILVGAFGVGIGFGLQTIVNNFVSGLILLFERPVKVGDEVKIGEAGGVVQRIGIRASVIRQWDNSEIIVPNSKLVSENVQNKTPYASRRGIEVPVNVVQGADVQKVMQILENAAVTHPLVEKNPKPQVLLTELNSPLLNFRLRVWTKQFDKIIKITSELTSQISSELSENNIPVVVETQNQIILEKPVSN